MTAPTAAGPGGGYQCCMAEDPPDSERSERRFVYALAYLLAIGLGAVLIVWMISKMTRTDSADSLVIRMGIALGAGLLVMFLVLAIGRRRSRGRQDR